MKRLHFVKAHDLSRLHDEILAAMPGLKPIPNIAGRVDTLRPPTNPPTLELEPQLHVEGRGDDIWLTVPDNADETAIASVVQAHNPSAAEPLTPTEARAQRITELLTISRSDWTTAQYRELLQLVAQGQVL